MRLFVPFGWCVLVFACFYTQNAIQACQCPAYSPSFVVKQGYRLYGHVIYWLIAEKNVLCRLKCNIDERCLTYNYEEKTKKCELNKADHGNLTMTKGFIYVDLKKPKKSPVASPSTSTIVSRPGTVTSASATPTGKTIITQITKTDTSISTTQTTKTKTSTSTTQTTKTDTSTSISPATSTSTTQTTSAVVSTSTTPLSTKPGQCKQVVAIGIQSKAIIPDDYITASTNQNIAKDARLNGHGGWYTYCGNNHECNGEEDGVWLQINVGKIAKITSIEIQGANYPWSLGKYLWTERFMLSYNNESLFTYYNDSYVFTGNTDWDTIVHHELRPPIIARNVRVHPIESNDNIGLRMELYECKDEGQCKQNVVIGIQNKTIIPDSYITASTNKDDAKKARLNGPGGWHFECKIYSTCQNYWLEINVGKIAKVIGIATQGVLIQSDHPFWMEKYTLSYSNGSVFTFYRQVFAGNTDWNTSVYNMLTPAITAIYVRIHPLEDYKVDSLYLGLRMELYECKEGKGICSYALGMQSGMIEDNQLSASSSNSNRSPSKARLNHASAWVAGKSYYIQWLQIDLFQVKKINGIASQGCRSWNAWVKEYSLQYRNDTNPLTLINYINGSDPVKFTGNYDRSSIVYNNLDPVIIAQIVRIVPTKWSGYIAMRVELYGCPYKGAYDGSKQP